MFGLWKTYRVRRAATAEIIPFVDGSRRRLGGIPDSAWHDPYVVGFLGMLITIIAVREASLDTDDLAAVQAGAWGEITGMPRDAFGEELCFLGASQDNRFVSGCRDAESFFHALDDFDHQRTPGFDAGAETLTALDESEAKSTLWSRYFDSHLNVSLTPVEA